MTEPTGLLTAEEFAERIKVGRTTVYALIAAGEVESVKIGKLRRIPDDEVPRYIGKLRAEQGAGAAA